MSLIQQVSEALQFGFIQKALIAGCLIAVSCSFLGVFLVLRRFSLIGDGLAHVSFATVAIGLLLHQQPILISLPLVALASLFILKLNEKAGLHGDAAIGLVASFGVAGGVLIASLAGGFNVDLMSYLFGSILSISTTEVWITWVLSIAIIVCIVLFYHDLFAITADEDYARVLGINPGTINKVLILLTSFTVVIGIKVVGTMLISSLIILPAVAALQIARSFKTVILTASLFSLISVLAGIFISYIFDLPSGATIVLINFTFFVCAWVASRFMK
ncbi:MAG: metal ABC transporter permease [Candidatus Omnitrophota bacterium]|jgi:zinc transport system permease protein